MSNINTYVIVRFLNSVRWCHVTESYVTMYGGLPESGKFIIDDVFFGIISVTVDKFLWCLLDSPINLFGHKISFIL